MRRFMIALGLFVSMSCSSSEQPKPVPVVDLRQVAQTEGLFSVAQDASMLTVQVVKDESVPVKGALNFKSGQLNVKSGAPNLVLEVDMKSWDSGLTARDNNVTQVFFNVLKESNTTTRVEATIPEDILAGFRAAGTLDNFKTTLNITFNGVTKPTEVLLSAKPDDKGHIVVQTMKKITLKISDFALGDNLKKLMELCNHKSVSDEIEVGVYLALKPGSGS